MRKILIRQDNDVFVKYEVNILNKNEVIISEGFLPNFPNLDFEGSRYWLEGSILRIDYIDMDNKSDKQTNGWAIKSILLEENESKIIRAIAEYAYENIESLPHLVEVLHLLELDDRKKKIIHRRPRRW